MSERELLLGVSGGHTTQAVIAISDGTVMGRGIGPGSNHHRTGIEKARQAVLTAIEGAFISMHEAPELSLMPGTAASWATRIRAACFGLSVIDGPQDEELFRSWLRSLGCQFPLMVGNDSDLVLGGGTPDGWGVALIAGTGSICLGRTQSGQTARVGGWGHVLGDDGSGYQIAAQALRLATKAADGRGGSPALLQAALSHWALKEPKQLIEVVARHETSADDVAGFAARVLELAGRNDPSASMIVDSAAEELALHVQVVVNQLGFKEPPLALGGLMMRMSLKRMVLDKVTGLVGPVAVVVDLVTGAIATARRLLAM